MEGGKYHKSGKSKVTTLKSSLIPGSIHILENELSLNTKEYEIDERSAVNNAINARLMVYRPMIKNWSLEFTLSIDTTMFERSFVRNILEDAGKKCGLLSYTPRHKGWFGCFKVVSFETVKD